MVESGSIPEKGRILAIIEKLLGEYRKSVQSVCVPKNGRIRVRKMVEFVRVSKSCWGSTGKRFNQCVYQKMVESGSVPEKGRIPASIARVLGEYRKRVQSVCLPKNGRIRVGTGKR